MNENLTELKRRALELFEKDQVAADKWLNEKLPILGNQTPLESAESAKGFEEVVMLIDRLEHGVLS